MKPGVGCALMFAAAGVHACGAQPGGQAQATPWDQWRVGRIVGESVGSDPNAIGMVSETAISSQSEIIILDGAERRILAFDTLGTILARGGSAGAGPGEMRDPVAVLVTAGDTVLAVDRTLRRIQIFEPAAAGLGTLQSVPLDFAPHDACALHDDALFILGERGTDYLHKFVRYDGSPHSMAPVPPPADVESPDDLSVALRRSELSGGLLICAPPESVVVHIPEYLGEMFGLSISGRVLWTQVIDSFIPPVRTPRPGGVRMDIDERFGFANRAASAVYLGEGLAQVVIQTTYPRSQNRERESTAIVFRVADGRTIARLRAFPSISATSPSLAIENLEEPLPAVRMWWKSR